MNYRELILNKLIDKYEKSKLSKEGSSRNIKISLKFDIKNMEDYCSEDSYKYIDRILRDVNFLESKDYIIVNWYKDRIQKVILNINKIYEIYDYLNREPRISINNRYIDIMNKYNKTNEVISFKKYIIDLLNKYKIVSKYFENCDELECIMKVLNNLYENSDEISLRNYSAKYLNDSKRLERLEIRFNNIIKDIFNSDDTFEEFLKIYNIYKNPTILHIRGNGIFKINNFVIDLSKIGNELIISSNQLKDFHIVNLDIKSVITVENLTTFNDINYGNNLVIYLGGFHNNSKKILLQKIYNYDSKISFVHLGDIDAGGFYILNHLIEDTGIKFSTYKMNLETLKEYSKYSKKMNDNDIDRLNRLKNIGRLKEYYDTFDYMLENNMKLEQENIVYFKDN